MVYSDSNKFIFLAVPKTGSKSMQFFLQDYGKRSQTGWVPNHDTYEQVKKLLGDQKFEDYFKFAFFRNPWSRMISVFFYNIHKHKYPTDKKGVIKWLNDYREYDDFAPYIFDKNGNVALDFIGKLENVEKDVKVVCEKLNIPPPEKMPHKGKVSTGGRLHYTEYYDEPLIKKIGDMFSNSLSVLKYEFGDGV